MAEAERPLLDQLREEVSRLGGELRQMAALRWQLARLEVEADLRQVRRLALSLTVAAVMGVVALALLCVALAELMERWLGGSRVGWLALLAAVLLAGAALMGWLAWRAFRRRFTGLQETLEELREDAVWIGEWRKRKG
jgi:uncharacterized membrane protein YqjE